MAKCNNKVKDFTNPDTNHAVDVLKQKNEEKFLKF